MFMKPGWYLKIHIPTSCLDFFLNLFRGIMVKYDMLWGWFHECTHLTRLRLVTVWYTCVCRGKCLAVTSIFLVCLVAGLAPQCQCVLTCRHTFYPVTGGIRTGLCNVQIWPKHICNASTRQRRWVLFPVSFYVNKLTSGFFPKRASVMEKKEDYLKK